MNIDFEKLIKLMLPISVRNGLQYIIAAIASVIQNMYDEFVLWQVDMRLQAQMTCQVMYLELILNYRLLNTFTRTIYITDGDGVTVDFIVNVPALVQVDANRMIGLIEKYKTFGKRYTIGQSQYTYEINWSDFVCEKALVTYEANWSGFVCENTYVDELMDNNIRVEDIDLIIKLSADYPVTSEITARVGYMIADVDYDVLITISVGSIHSYLQINEHMSNLHIISLNITSDSTYRYIQN